MTGVDGWLVRLGLGEEKRREEDGGGRREDGPSRRTPCYGANLHRRSTPPELMRAYGAQVK